MEKEDSHFVPLQIIDFQHPGVVLEDKERAAVLFSAIEQLAENQQIDAFKQQQNPGEEKVQNRMDRSATLLAEGIWKALHSRAYVVYGAVPQLAECVIVQ